MIYEWLDVVMIFYDGWQVIDAFNNLLVYRWLECGGIFYSDVGSQYTSNDYEDLLKTLKVWYSYSKKDFHMIMQVWKSSTLYKKEKVNVNTYRTLKKL